VEFILFLALTAIFAASQAALPQDPAAQSASAVQSQASYQPITGDQRLRWFVNSTLGPTTLEAGLFTAAIGTARNAPREYGPHWDGFAKRNGIRLTGLGTSNAIEASLGALWGEDPRYVRASGEPFKSRVNNVVISTFTAHNPSGGRMPAFARFVAIPGNNFLSNTWRADSEATNHSAALRTLWGFLGEMGKNAFLEFWPDARQHIFHRKQ
jgi:hypothetical protein